MLAPLVRASDRDHKPRSARGYRATFQISVVISWQRCLVTITWRRQHISQVARTGWEKKFRCAVPHQRSRPNACSISYRMRQRKIVGSVVLRSLGFPQRGFSSGWPPCFRARLLKCGCGRHKALAEAEWLPHLGITIGNGLRRDTRDLGARDGDEEK